MTETTTPAGDLIGLNGVRVLAQQCGTCVFFPDNRMHLRPGALHDLVTASRPAGWLTCHKTLSVVAGYGRAAVCCGWERAYGLGTTLDELVALFGREDVYPEEDS